MTASECALLWERLHDNRTKQLNEADAELKRLLSTVEAADSFELEVSLAISEWESGREDPHYSFAAVVDAINAYRHRKRLSQRSGTYSPDPAAPPAARTNSAAG
jgi:hypothetical protein